jgi:hypothetical protein
VALEFGLARWRPERGETTGAKDWWLSPWRGHQRETDMLKTSYCDVVEHLGTWHPTDRWPTPVSLSEPAVSQADTAAGAEQCLKLIRGEDLFTPRRYLGTDEHESPRRRESRRGGRQRQGALHLESSSVTVLSEQHSEHLTERFTAPRSPTFM